MTGIDSTRYPTAIDELLRSLPLAPLGPGKPREEMRAKLESAAASFPAHADRDMVAACMAGLWLAFDFLDESHSISQNLSSSEGSYWHALMHRREPDHDNSKYWFRRIGAHPVLQQLVEQAPSLGYTFTDPFVFVDFVERVRGTGSADEETARRVQRHEWELLFDSCFRRVI
jgi:hypothetical protein